MHLQEMLPTPIQEPLQNYKNPRGGSRRGFIRYPPMYRSVHRRGDSDGRLAYQPVADGVSPSAGKDVNGPTAAAALFPDWIITLHQTVPYLIKIPSLHSAEEMDGELCRADPFLL